MAAVPKNGAAIFRGKSGQTYSYSLYWSDVANAFLTFATTASAGSGSVNFITAPEDMVLEDISVASGLTDTTSIVLWLDDAPVRNTILVDANIVNTVTTRNFPKLRISGGRKVQFAQLA